MKRIAIVMLTAALFVTFSTPFVAAAEKKANTPTSKTAPPDKNKPSAPAKNGSQAAQVTQCELAQLLVQILGLSRFLPASPSCDQCFSALMDNAISPRDGWVSAKVVVKKDLARVIIQAMKRQGEVEDPNKDESWEKFLASLGVSLDSVGESVDQMDSLAEPVAPHVVSGRTDPLLKRHRFNPADEMQYGVDMEFIMQIITQLELGPTGQFYVPPVTPT
jgi:hypothetical protein